MAEAHGNGKGFERTSATVREGYIWKNCSQVQHYLIASMLIMWY